MAIQEAVKEAITQYFHAWNNYDADALKDCSDPLSTEASVALLLNLAAAKRAGVTITAHDSRIVHVEGSMAIVETGVSVLGKPEAIWHLLRQTNVAWKVVVRLFTEFSAS